MLLTSATDDTPFTIDGGSNPYSASLDAFTIRNLKNLSWAGDIAGVGGFYNNVKHLSAAATISTTKTWNAFHNLFENTGKVTNDNADNLHLYQQPFYLQTSDTGTYDTSTTGQFDIQNRGAYALISSSPTLTDTGGTGPSSSYDVFGSLINITNTPTVSSGSWSVKSYGQHITVTGNTAGLSRAYGIYIASVSGADAGNNYAIYDNSGQPWRLDSDDQEIQIGESGDATLLYDGTDFWINPAKVGTGSLKVGTSTNHAEITEAGDVKFAGSAGFYPPRLSQSAEPSPDTAELIVWRDSDDNKTYLVYNDTDEGVRKVELI